MKNADDNMSKFKVGEKVRLRRSLEAMKNHYYGGEEEERLFKIKRIVVEEYTWYSMVESTLYRYREDDLVPICKLNRDANKMVESQ